ncbi:MAG: cation:proton antiporter [Gammaproteobacteria bacterium]
MEHAMITLAVIVVFGIACQWLAWWLKLPAILFLLLAGLVVGPFTGYFRPDQLFGDLLFPMVSLGVAVILFEGSLTLHLGEIKGLARVVRNLVTVGAVLNAVIIAAATRWFLDFSWEMAFLFGALVSVTGPTVIVPMLRTVRPNSKLANILRWEGIMNEAGLLAVTVMGMILANMKNVPIEEILDFKESLSVLLISLLFIVLAARVDFQLFAAVGWGALLVFLVILFVARPAMVLVSTLGSKLNWREKTLLSWVAPRGIVAAAVSALFALRLQKLGFAHADLLVPLTFMVIIGPVVLQSATARPLANRLKVSEPEPRGVLIVGANPVSRAIAKFLTTKGFRVVIADTYWDDVRTARMEGLATYYGNVVSEHADRHLDLVGVGRLFAMSRRPALNALACMRYRSEFGANNVYTLQTAEEKGAPEKQAIATHIAGPRLFGESVTHSKLASMIGQGAEIRGTQLSESFDYASYREKYGKGLVPLFALDTHGELRVFYVGGELEPGPGWTVISLLPPENEKQASGLHEGSNATAAQSKAGDSAPA